MVPTTNVHDYLKSTTKPICNTVSVIFLLQAHSFWNGSHI